MKDNDQNLLSEAYKRIYMEEDSISVDDAIEKFKAGESLMVLNADGQEFVVAGDDEEGIVDDEGKLRFNGNGPDGEEASALEDEVSRIRSLSDHETIRTPEFDPNNPNASLDPANPMHRMAKIGSDEHYGEDKEEDKDKSTGWGFGGQGQVKQDFNVGVRGGKALSKTAKKGWDKLKAYLSKTANEKCNKDSVIKQIKHSKRHER